MSLQDNIGHLQADTVLVREDTSFPDTIRVSTSLVEAPSCVLEAIRPAPAWPAAVLTPEMQGTKPSGTTGLRPPSPQAVRGDRFVPRLANVLSACLPRVRRNFNS